MDVSDCRCRTIQTDIIGQACHRKIETSMDQPKYAYTIYPYLYSVRKNIFTLKMIRAYNLIYPCLNRVYS